MAIKEYQNISLDGYLKYFLCTSKLIVYILSWYHKVSLGSDRARSSTQKTHDYKEPQGSTCVECTVMLQNTQGPIPGLNKGGAFQLLMQLTCWFSFHFLPLLIQHQNSVICQRHICLSLNSIIPYNEYASNEYTIKVKIRKGRDGNLFSIKEILIRGYLHFSTLKQILSKKSLFGIRLQ